MTKGDQLVRALRGHHAGNDRRVEYRTFLCAVSALTQSECDSPGEAYASLGNGDAMSYFFRADVDHSRAILAVEMG